MNNKERALLVAERVHANQTYDIYPYIYHVKQVAYILEELGYDETIVIAGILHDCLEDGDLTYNDIKKAFGLEVAEIVFAVTDEVGRNRDERKRKTYPKIRNNWKAVVVKIADRIANIVHSMKYNKTMFNMYAKEHNGFCSALMSGEHNHNETNRAWEKLHKITKTKEDEKTSDD